MRLTHTFQQLYSFLCLSLITAIFSTSTNAQVLPYTEPDERHLIPRKTHLAPVDSFLSSKRLYPEELDVLSLYSAPIERLPNHPTKLTELPLVADKEKPNDKIYDLSSRFPNIQKGDKQWVHYNLTTGHITANANTYLRTSIREYLLRIEAESPLVLKTTGYLVKLDIHADPSLKKILSLIEAKSGKVKILETITSKHTKNTFFGLNIIDKTKSSIGTQINREKGTIEVAANLLRPNSGLIKISAVVAPNETNIFECGLTDGETKQFLILTVNTTTEKGRIIEIPKTSTKILKIDSLGMSDPTKNNQNDDPFETEHNDIQTIEYYKVPSDIFDTMSLFRSKLVTAPDSQYFKSSDLVYDISPVTEMSGIPTSGSIFYNWTHHEITSQLEVADSEMLSSLLENYSQRMHSPPNLDTTATIYEVNIRPPEDEAWNMHMIINSQPKLICRSAFCNIEENISRQSSQLGTISLQQKTSPTIDNRIFTNQSWEINIDSKQLKLKESVEAKVLKNGVSIIDIKDLGNGRSVIMVIDTKVEPYYTFIDRFQEEEDAYERALDAEDAAAEAAEALEAEKLNK